MLLASVAHSGFYSGNLEICFVPDFWSLLNKFRWFSLHRTDVVVVFTYCSNTNSYRVLLVKVLDLEEGWSTKVLCLWCLIVILSMWHIHPKITLLDTHITYWNLAFKCNFYPNSKIYILQQEKEPVSLPSLKTPKLYSAWFFFDTRKRGHRRNTECNRSSTSEQRCDHYSVQSRTCDYTLDIEANSLVSGHRVTLGLSIYEHMLCVWRPEQAISSLTWQQQFDISLCLATFSSTFSIAHIHLALDMLMALNWSCHHGHIKFKLAPNDITF